MRNALLLFLLLSQAVSGQELRGKLTNSKGNEIHGASILLLPSGTGTFSSEDGTFQLRVPSDSAVVIISNRGYHTRELKIYRDQLPPMQVIVLKEDILNLDEVVVTGNASAVTKRTLGNSISTINGDQEKYTSSGHLSSLLNGRIMGGVVTQNSGDPAGGFSLKLRGVGSLYGSSEPLYIIDGIIIDNSSANVVNLNLAQTSRFQTGTNRLVDINPRDIEKVEVINGPAAAAIYGSRAANGVVQIFTKKGTTGKPEVTYQASVTLNTLARRIEVNEYPYRFGYTSPGSRLTEDTARRTIVQNFRRNTTALPPGGPQSTSGRLDTAKYPVKRYDYQDDLFSPAWGTDHTMSIRGGNEAADYYVSGSYLNNGGILSGTNFERYGLTVRTQAKLTNWMRLSASLMYSGSRSKEMPNSFLQFSPLGAMNHTDNVYNISERDPQGNLLAVENSWVNPLSNMEGADLTVNTRRTIAGLALNLTPLKGLTIDGHLGQDGYSQEGSAYQARLPYPAALNQFPDGYVSVTKNNYAQWSADLSVTYKRKLGRDLSSSTSAGYAGQFIRKAYQSQEGRDLVPFIKTIAAAKNLFSAPVDERSEQTVYGVFLQETLSYKDLMHLTLAGRFDASSAFGSNAGSIFYPKAALSFSMSDLQWWKDAPISKWFNTLLLRAAYGEAGNLTGIGPYDRFTGFTAVNYYTTGFVARNTRGNQDIRPEVKSELEAGADMQFLNGRLYTRMNVYRQVIKDLVIPFNWAPSNGSNTILDNLGNMENKGFEIMAGGRPVDKKNFSWEVSLLVNRNRNKVTTLYKDAPFIGFDQFNLQGALVGYPISTYYGVYYARNPDGSLLLSNNNGYLLPQVERGDPATEMPNRKNGQPDGTPVRKPLGDPNPDYTSTLVNSFRYKNFSLRLQIDRVAGFEVFNFTDIIRNNIGNGKLAEKELRGELTRGWVAAVGGLVNGPFMAEEAVEDGTFTKLREVTLGYLWKGSKYFQRMEFLLSARNVFMISGYNGYDPETNTAGQSIVRGLDYFSVPGTRSFQFTIITTFK